jgi:hypothetical protein
MKTILLLGLVLGALTPAQAQIFHPASFRGHSGGRGDGHSSYYRGGYGPWWGIGFGAYYGTPRTSIYLADYGSSGTYGYDAGYYDTGYYAQPGYQASGTWLGALAGAIIGRNSGSLGHNAWRGAAYGAGLGYILGTVADINVHAREAATARPMSVQGATQMAAPAAPAQPVTIINNYYNAPATAMSPANGLFGR